MLAEQKIHKAIKQSQQALNYIKEENKRLAVGELDRAKENLYEAVINLIIEIEEEEGYFDK